MGIWMIALAGYFAVGLVLVFVGPAARLRRHERLALALQAYNQPRWQLIAFSCAIGICIIVLWPFLTISAARTEAAKLRDDPFRRQPSPPAEPSPELDLCISDIQNRYSNSLPFEEYQKILSKLPWTDRGHFDSRLVQLGYVLTGFATDSHGQDLAAAVPLVLEIGMPFALTRLRGRADSLPAPRRLAKNEISFDPLDRGISFQIPPKPDDEVWQFSSSAESWENLAGRKGLALVRERTVIDAYVTIMN